MNIRKKWTAAMLLLAFSLALFAGLPLRADAETASTRVNRFNVVLVVDKSGSLRDLEGHGTDPLGLRFDAMRLFLGLLTETGNNVGAVVFDEQIRFDSGVLSMESMEAKKALIRSVEGFDTSYDTDIGSAVLRATEILSGMREENGLPCMILLLTDGQTDFTTGYYLWARKLKSWAKGEQAVKIAQSEGITINGILLNVDGKAEGGAQELSLYTNGTGGAFEEVKRPEDLTAAFRHFYSIINNTEYSGAEKVAFSQEGTAETRFMVPSFGVEEVNVIVEHETVEDGEVDAVVDVAITQPDGSRFDPAGRELLSSRYLLIKIPHPALGEWTVDLRGDPGDTVDITMVYNPSMKAVLNSSSQGESYLLSEPYRFTLTVEDPSMPEITAELLANMEAKLTVQDLASGKAQTVSMAMENGVYTSNLSFPRSGQYSVTATVGQDGFEVRSNTLNVSAGTPAQPDAFPTPVPIPQATPEVPLQPLKLKVASVSDMFELGRFTDDGWELALDELFSADARSQVSYTLSDDYDGALTIEDDKLVARRLGTDYAAFSLTAADDQGHRVQIPFDFEVPAVSTETWSIMDLQEYGRYGEDCWELELEGLFEDPKGTALDYELSDDYNGAITIEDGVLRARFGELDSVDFSLTATDTMGLSESISFDLDIPTVSAKASKITNMLSNGSLHGDIWETDLTLLFSDPKGTPVTYALSDDLDGALTLTDDYILQWDVGKLKKASFTVTATDLFGHSAETAFSLSLPGPAAQVTSISETIKTGLFQEGTWERRVDSLFREPKGTKMSYALSDTFGGQVELSNGRLHADCKGLKQASFTVRATDEYGLSAEIPVTLTEKNMTIVYLLWALLALVVIAVPVGIIVYRARH